MSILETIGLQALLFLFISLICSYVHYKWRNAVAKKEEIKRLVDMVSKESAMVEFESVYEYNSAHKLNQCAVCRCPTTTRCSQCKSVHYCSGKCQIIHWRSGHKYECRPLSTMMHKQESEFCERSAEKQYEIRDEECELLANVSTNKELGYSRMGISERPFEDISHDLPSTRSNSQEMQETKSFPPKSAKSVVLANVSTNKELGYSHMGRSERPFEDISHDLPSTRSNSQEMQETKSFPPKSAKSVACVNGVSRASKSNKIKSSCNDEVVSCNSQLPNGKVMCDDARTAKSVHKRSIRRAASSEMLLTDASDLNNSTLIHSVKLDTVNDTGEDDSRLLKGREARSLSFNASDDHTRDASNSLKSSVWKKVQQLRGKQSNIYEMTFPYELFVKLYSCNEELNPFGLRNCGNSCYANTVIQCLAFTRPLTSYFARGLHSKSCRKKGWCFNCEFQLLILKARGGESPLSPIRILSKIQKIGSHLGHGREEDAHEFLRYAIDTMQSVFLKEAGSLGMSEETTLVGATFGGYIRSKIKCMRCFGKSERFERIMDLTVEIDGNIESLEQALTQFTADEMLDGENKYNCSRCKSYVKAKKKLTIVEAPNILTIVLKRFQSSNFGKLNKSVRYPEVLDMAPYLCGRNDKFPQYGLYAVVVHRDTMSDASTGHYVCYIKTPKGDWFGINDSTVMPVELERVLSEEAYMLLYARHCPRAPVSRKSNAEIHGMKSQKRVLEAIPSNNLNTSKTRGNSYLSNSDLSKAELKHDKYLYWMARDDLTRNKLGDPDDWRFRHVDSSSENSSLFSWSDASSCSTASTKDSVKSEDLSEFLFGDTGPSWYGHRGY